MNARVTEFQSVRDSTQFDIGDVTCLVGKNEAGKTALLKAIYRLNPINAQDAEYDVTNDYPRSTMNDYENAVDRGERPHSIVVRCTFELEPEDTALVADVYGSDCLPSETLTMVLSKGYSNELSVEGLTVHPEAAVDHLVRKADLPESIVTNIDTCESVKEKIAVLVNASGLSESGENLRSELREIDEHGLMNRIYGRILQSRVPKFLYFDSYYQLRGEANIEALRTRMRSDSLEDPDHPLLGLINLAGLDLERLISPGRTEALIAKLEGAENELTRKVLTYWSQNRHLGMKFDVRPAQPGDPEGMTSGTNILGRVQDTRHMVSTPLGTRSRGFVWFFSFLAWYSQLRREGANLILLLDEPGLSLHAKAQGDLLRYFEEELRPNHQVVYTTHSPFMVDPRRFNRVRIVQDRSIDEDPETLRAEDEGTKVTTDVLSASSDTLFPLQAALGYEIHQTLFVGPNCLVVEGVSDLLYFQAISDLLQARGRAGLSSDWTITPVGGLDKVPTFVALIGAQAGINLATIVDYQEKDKQTIENLYKRKLMTQKHVLTYADFVEAKEADIEDMFTPEFYLQLVNGEFQVSLEECELPSCADRILVRVESLLSSRSLPNDARFNHYRPARYFVENLSELCVPEESLQRFERLFRSVNDLLE